ncbi:MAG: hypothetical protein K8S27_05455 [Candidatus Omnitrophica bacterium]|nr:hypothetical protein [Candidatus Omnitrophota bacterium]
MCGIFGFAASQNTLSDKDFFKRSINRLFVLSETRGKEAAGIALRTDQAIYLLKQPRPASGMIRSRAYHQLWSANNGMPLAAIGHSRLVTNGSQLVHANNQPIRKDNIIGVHNGIIVNADELWRGMPDVQRECEIDSEVIFGRMKQVLLNKGRLSEALRVTYQAIEGNASIAVLFDDVNVLALATNNGSLYLAFDPEHHFFAFASEEFILNQFIAKQFGRDQPGSFQVLHLEARQGCLVGIEDLSYHVFDLTENHAEKFPVNRLERRINIQDVTPEQETETPPGRHNPITRVPPEFRKHYDECRDRIARLRRCRRCVLPETMPFIDFDEEGICSYCRSYHPFDTPGEQELTLFLESYRRPDHQPDCIISLSGGRDSCYALHYFKEIQGMHPIAFTYDWGMVTDLARRNQARLCGKLGIEHIIVSADIEHKRQNIRTNVLAWLKKPDLGMIPLFMAGDKQYFHYANQVRKQTRIPLLVMAENAFEKTNFKTGFCRVVEKKEELSYAMSYINQTKMIGYYLTQFIKNPAYMNASIFDTVWAYVSYYSKGSHEYVNLFKYIPWNEDDIIDTLIGQYKWELSPDTESTWRIGDGTAPFYNYIYYSVAGFTENDTFRSNQIRAGVIDRQEALEHITKDNRPRYDTFQEYCQLIQIDWLGAMKRIHQIQKMY